MINIFLDLDGPLLDNSGRLYGLYTDLLRRLGKRPLSLHTYWSLKRNCISEENIIKKSLGEDAAAVQKYLKERQVLIESRYYLKKNKLVEGCLDALEFLSLHGRLFLITTRKSRRNLLWELKHNKIRHFFSGLLCGVNKDIPAWKTKADMIKKNIVQYSRRDIIIGDTEAEIICGRKLRLFSIAVVNGIRKKELLTAMRPDMICKNIKDVVFKWHSIKSDEKIKI